MNYFLPNWEWEFYHLSHFHHVLLLSLLLQGINCFPSNYSFQSIYLTSFLKIISCFFEKHFSWQSSSNSHESRCIEDAKSSNNKISTLTAKKYCSRRLILQFIGINHILCYASPALAAPIVDMNEPEVIRFVCLSSFSFYISILTFILILWFVICDLLFLCEASRTLKLASGVRIQGNKKKS